jgi:hypothetical protein
MRVLDATRRELDLSEYKNRAAEESDCSQFIKDSVIVKVNGKTVITYFSYVDDMALDRMAEVLPKIEYQTSTRTNGLVTTSRIFGFAPRNELRRQPCRSTGFASDQPNEHAIVAAGSRVVEKYYVESFPELAQYHKELTLQNVKPQYHLENTMFTSGIVNHNNPLRYHFDSGNFKNVCSAMLAFKHKVSGGHLCVPELDMMFEIADRSLLLFDGQGLVHGVTPIKKLAPDAHRFTVVYYSLQQMWNCEAIGDEIARMRARRTDIERRKAHNESETAG